jgi:PhnB protein
MEICSYLGFNGQCEEAFKSYEKILGGKIQGLMTYGGSPMASHFPPEMHSRVIHVRMVVGTQVLMGGDAPPQHYQAPQGLNVSITTKDPADTERIFNELSAGGKITMPLQKTFWSVLFGMTVDRFGTPWIVNCAQAA